jgi:rod shape-determining protein MreD
MLAWMRRIEYWMRQSAPMALSLFVVLVSVVPLRIPEYARVAPDFGLMAVFFWTVHRPDLLRPWGAFVIGLFDDILTGAPLGLGALIFVLAHGALIAQHKVFRGKPFGLIWLSFGMIAMGAAIATYVAAVALAGVWILPGLWATQLALTFAGYPLMGWLMGRAQRAFLSQPEPAAA